MSITNPTVERGGPTPESRYEPEACAHCGTPLQEDQEWCLECGAAQTLIHRAPDWRVPVAVIGGVVVVALVAFVIALINLSSSTDHSVNRGAAAVPAAVPISPSSSASRTTAGGTSTPAASSTTAGASTSVGTTPTALGTTTTPQGATVAAWPVGLSGWTVVIARYNDQATANATATRLTAEGLHVGVTFTSNHPSLKPGGWVVFTGRYADRAHAAVVAERLRALGHSARAREVAP